MIKLVSFHSSVYGECLVNPEQVRCITSPSATSGVTHIWFGGDDANPASQITVNESIAIVAERLMNILNDDTAL